MGRGVCVLCLAVTAGACAGAPPGPSGQPPLLFVDASAPAPSRVPDADRVAPVRDAQAASVVLPGDAQAHPDVQGGTATPAPPPATPDAAPVPLAHPDSVPVPRGSHGKCTPVFWSCACAYRCRWLTGGPLDAETDCANVCAQPEPPTIHCDVVDGRCGQVP